MDETAHRLTPAPADEPPPDPAVVRAELHRILSSSTFQHAKHAQRFLTHIVEAQLAGRGHDLKEYTVGVEVFGKDSSFDPRIDSIVRTEARRLRARLEDFYNTEGDHGGCRIVLRKGSYVPAFEAVARPTPEPVIEASLPAAAAPAPRTRFRSPLVIVAACVALVVAATVAGRFLPSRTDATAPTSIVVLPFVNLSGADHDFLVDGLTEELINSLGRMRDLRVIGRASAFQFKGEKIDLREIGRRLGVRYVLEGSVKESGGRLRTSVWLEDTTTGFRDWSQTFEHDVQNTWIIEREIASAVANALGDTVGEDVADAARPVHPEAYQLYLKGRYFWNKSTEADIETAIELFEQAIAKDPGYAPAYSGLASSYNAMVMVSARPVREYTAKIRAAATRALALDDTLGEAHSALAIAYAREGSLAAAEQEYIRAIELSPSNALTYRGYSHHLQRTGRVEEALAIQRRAVELDPVTAYQTQRLGEILYLMRRYDEAIAEYHNALSLDPNFAWARRGLGLTYLQKQQYGPALTELQQAYELLRDPRTAGELAYAYGISAERPKAQAILSEFLSRAPSEYVPPIAVARAYLGLGDTDRTLEWLSRAVDEGELVALSVDPTYDPLRGDPRFAELLARMKLS